MHAWQHRVIVERDDLREKLNKLAVFIDENRTFQALPPVEQESLRGQRSAMFDYQVVLDARISRFTDGT